MNKPQAKAVIETLKARTFADFKTWAWESWSSYHGLDPTWTKAQFVNLKKIHTMLGDTEARQVWTTYLRCDDKFFREHSPNKLISALDKFRLDSRRLNEIKTETKESPRNTPLVELIRKETLEIMEETGLDYHDAFYLGVRRRNEARGEE